MVFFWEFSLKKPTKQMFLSSRFRNQHREHTIAIIKMRICIQLNPSRNFWVLNLFGPRANKSSFLGLGTFFLTSHKAKDNRQAWKRKSGDFLSDSIYHTSRKVGGNPLISDETCGNVIKRRPVKYFLSYTYLLKAIFGYLNWENMWLGDFFIHA